MDDGARGRLLRDAIKVLQISLPSTCQVAKLEAMLEELLDHPAERLAVYGTLAPGEANHALIANIQGTWRKGWVPGVLGRIGPYPAFQWKSDGKRIPVQVLSSSHLDRHWGRLDRFEGTAYRRILAPITLAGGTVQVANIYEAVELP